MRRQQQAAAGAGAPAAASITSGIFETLVALESTANISVTYSATSEKAP